MAPDLTTWAQVDPARYPFDPADITAVVRAVAPAPESAGESQTLAWVDAVSLALAQRYGPWAYHWYWTPGEHERWGWIGERIPVPAEAPAFVAESLQAWRRFLESLAEQFNRFLRSLPLKLDELLPAWEAAIAQVMTTVIAHIVDADSWQGWCRRALRWLLTAAGVPAEHAQALVDVALGKRFDHWVPVTATIIGEVAERLARDLLDPTGIMLVARIDNWPDTWPQRWPSWRATNTGWVSG
ncbi:hypothetical protein Rhe02_96510 [Rhizocola hellebori]|uniref:Uncharacterized protein n=1 Tax=Rhizocola hellebori TaxID=1392758 RepID=A0A8J3QKQ8_9ACTN|nr:hypothetical protein [Rhizocola hellebori]GIH11584.1 hypothetical protein Rhe02_96510 [Rhizocola hellebori]